MDGERDMGHKNTHNIPEWKVKREFEVAFIVNKEMKTNILGFTPIRERICRLHVKTRFFNLSVINVHAPMEDKDETEKDEFYN
jgi:hypothetical protein